MPIIFRILCKKCGKQYQDAEYMKERKCIKRNGCCTNCFEKATKKLDEWIK